MEEASTAENIVTVNFKIPAEMRDEFKMAAKNNGMTMQTVIFFLVRDYIDNSDHLKFKLVDARGNNGRK